MYPKESLEIIGKMMNDTRLNVMRNAYGPLLVWGWVSFFISIVTYLGLLVTGDYLWNFSWFLIPVVGLPIVRHFYAKKEGVSTAITRSLVNIWRMLTILIVVFSITSFFVRFNVLSVILMILAIGSFITGELIRYPFLKYSSIPGFLLAASLWWISGLSQILVFGVSMILMMVIPAYKIKHTIESDRL